MQFPVFQVPYFGNGMAIGTNAVIHVLLSHGVAIGTFMMLAISEWSGVLTHRANRRVREEFNGELLKLMVILITVFGAITGAGIWFTISALSPRTTGSMLRIFFWPWFVEWIIFVLEAVTLLVLYFGWPRWTGARARIRTALAGFYAILASVSAVLITGILSFMLTPGDWPLDRWLKSAFFNPSFLPQLVSRLGLSFVLGALIAGALLLFKKRDTLFQKEMSRIYGVILLGSLFIFWLGLATYIPNIPVAFRVHTVFSVLTSNFAQYPNLFTVGNLLISLVLLVTAALAISGKTRAFRFAIPVCLLLFSVQVAEFERIREFIRGPYTMPGYMYANGVTTSEHLLFKEKGMLPFSTWHSNPRRAGAFLFARNCAVCHTVDGINGIRARFEGRTEDSIFVLLGRTHEMIAFMPPFSGNEAERRLTARFLYDLTQGKGGHE